jgi:NAD(P)-dependent dehydrogenase (short-subunit alcohol dehydrogenase family)
MDHELLTTPFGATSTAAEVSAGVDLTGKTAIVTGGSSGIGVETARALAAAGAAVTLAVRSVEAGERTARDISATTGNRAVTVAELDLADHASIARFVADWQGPLDILVENAGIMALPDLHRSPEGWELQFATNHLGHFALATGLHDALAAAAAPGVAAAAASSAAGSASAAAGSARVVVVSSVGHQGGGIDFDDPMFERRDYDQWLAYGQSKTANILFAVEASKRWGADGITVNALNPGRIPATGLSRHVDPEVTATMSAATSDGVSVKNVEQGAATSVLLAASPLLAGIGGRYFEDCNEAGVATPGIRRGVAPYALDAADAERLWLLSEELLAGARQVAP